MQSTFVASSLLLLLRLYSSVDDCISKCVREAYKIYSKLAESFSLKTYVFFEYVTSPYNLSHVNISASSSAVPQWYYLPDENTFVGWELGANVDSIMNRVGKAVPLPVLSMEIVDGARVVYDLTDFTQSIKVYPRVDGVFPSVAHILGAWSLSSRIVLDRNRDFTASILDTNANQSEKGIYDCDYMYESCALQSDDDVGDAPMVEEVEAEEVEPEDLSGNSLNPIEEEATT